MSSYSSELSNFIWSIADLLRGPYRPPQYERVMLPLTVLRRFDGVLEGTKAAVVQKYKELEANGMAERLKDGIDPILNKVAGGGTDLGFHNRSELDFEKLKGDPDNIALHLTAYINGFSANVRAIFRYFDFEKEIEKLLEANRLFLIVQKFSEMDLHPRRIDNTEMGRLFEELIRRFNEAANETAGDHFTPREVIRLMVNVLLEPDTGILTDKGQVVTIYDPTCGTGGMLSEGQTWIAEHNSRADVLVYGQDYNPRAYAVAASDLLMKGNRRSFVAYGNTLTQDQFDGRDERLPKQFDYLLANPPFGVDWKGQQQILEAEAARGELGRFPVKLPRVNDGALLFLLHMISKFQTPGEGGSRAAVVFNGSPLFTGGAGSGESEIRRYILENDWLEALIALPEQMFYNTGIGTFIWVVSNRKIQERRGKVQLIDARERWTPMRRSLGDKRRYLSDATIDELTLEHGNFLETATCRIFDSTAFGYRRVTVERPLRLRFQLSSENQERFLDAYPHFLDAVRGLETAFGRDVYFDWNEVWAETEPLVILSGIKWTAGARKDFRRAFTVTDPDAAPVVAKRNVAPGKIEQAHFPKHALPDWLEREELEMHFGLYPDPSSKKGRLMTFEPDPNLRDSENVPLSENVVSYFEREVKPFVPDAWIEPDAADEKDGGAGKVGYEVNFNRVFFKYEAPRPLEEIDAELEQVERRILELLQKVTA